MRKKSPKLAAANIVVLLIVNIFPWPDVESQEISNRKQRREWDEIARKERALFEEKVRAADGISEEEAVEIAQKALETDLGLDAKELVLTTDETFGWKSELCVADWSEIKEKDRGALAYQINFNNGEKVADFKDLINYNCTVNAVNGSILEAYSSKGLDGKAVYYGH